MVLDIPTVIFGMLFLALFPISFVWLRRAWRILKDRDYSEVALVRGEPPPNPKRFAPYTATVNLLAGLSLVTVILSVVLWGAFGIVLLNPDFQNWVAVAGSTIWLKIIFDFLVSRQAKLLTKQDQKKASAK